MPALLQERHRALLEPLQRRGLILELQAREAPDHVGNSLQEAKQKYRWVITTTMTMMMMMMTMMMMMMMTMMMMMMN